MGRSANTIWYILFYFHTVRILYVRSHLSVRCFDITFLRWKHNIMHASIYIDWLLYTFTHWIYVLYIDLFLLANEMYFRSCLNHVMVSASDLSSEAGHLQFKPYFKFEHCNFGANCMNQMVIKITLFPFPPLVKRTF